MPLKLELVRERLRKLKFQPVFDCPMPSRFDMRGMRQTFFWIVRPPVLMTIAYDEEGVLWVHTLDTFDLSSLGFTRFGGRKKNAV